MSVAILPALSGLLNSVGQSLDIPEHLAEDAVVRYEDVGEWLATDEKLSTAEPEVYPQGSFLLGTVVRPVTEVDDFDVDLVCQLAIEKEATTQQAIKTMIGSRLKAREDLAKVLSESRRCWTLSYPQKFHMDILPAIPNRSRPPTGILLTDRDLRLWQHSNPRAYASWFFQQMTRTMRAAREALAKATQASVADIPEWQAKTPLQRSVQLIKRHRDIYFRSWPDTKPVSIVLTTLAAHAYSDEDDLATALVAVGTKLASYVQQRDGRWWVENPVDAGENFADKWNEDPEKARAFFGWSTQLARQVTALTEVTSLGEAVATILPWFGERPVSEAGRALGVTTRGLSTAASNLSVAPAVPALGDSRHCRPPEATEDVRYRATVTATVHRKRKAKAVWALRHPVQKGLWLRFALHTDAPAPYKVRWQVVNTGREATEAGQLRGDFYDGDDNSDVRWESTKYKGTHWVEAFVIKEGRVVARSGRAIVRIRD